MTDQVKPMTPLEAWANISKRLRAYVDLYGYTPDDVEAEVICFHALKQEEEREKND